MSDKLKKRILSFLLILLIPYITYSIHLSNYREYTRSDYDGYISYPNDNFMPWIEKITAQLGSLFSLIITLIFVVIAFLGVKSFYQKYQLKIKIDEIVFYIFSIWLIVIFIYSVVTSLFGISFILEPFFGKGIHYLK